jgi:type I restriction enzyme S subunit
MNNFPHYDSYKDSGISWIGDIPEHWEVTKVKRLFFEKKKTNDITLNCGSISFGKVVLKDDEKIPYLTKKSYQVVLKGDFLVNPLNLNYDLVSLRIALSELDVVVSSGYIVLDTLVKLNKEYFKWLLHRFDVAFMKMLGSGVRQTLNYSDIGNSDLVFPPIYEQTAIANFLNHKTAQIDRAITQKEKLIELLQERRQILIHNAVTRGLNPNVRMKQSGVEWIGEIPEHWQVVRSKRLFQLRSERARKEDEQLTASQKFGVIPQREFMELEGRRVTQVEFNREILKHIEPNDFVISMRSFQGGIEFCKYRGCVSSAYIVLIPIKNIVPRFYQYLFKSYGYIQALSSTSNLVRDGQALRFENFSLVDLLLIPEEEQKNIADYLVLVLQKIETAISFKQKEIEKLKEYKAVLVDSAVTGKIKVCGNSQNAEVKSSYAKSNE